MPETLAVILVLVVSLGAYVAGVVQARRPIADYAAERSRARAQQAWLLEQMARARRENWDDAMVAELERQLAATTAELENLARR
jgi:hypothetical protein